MWSIGQNSTFSEHGHVANQTKWNHKIKQQGSKYLALRHPPPWPLGSKGLNSTFSDYGHVAYYQIKGIHECSNIVANILPSHHTTHPPWGWDHCPVAYQLERESQNAATWLKLYRLVYFYSTNHWKLVGRHLTLICMIPKVKLGVREKKIMFCDL